MPNFSTTHPFLTKNVILPISMLNIPIFGQKNEISLFCSKWGWQVWINGSAPAIVAYKIYDFLKLVSIKINALIEKDLGKCR